MADEMVKSGRLTFVGQNSTKLWRTYGTNNANRKMDNHGIISTVIHGGMILDDRRFLRN